MANERSLPTRERLLESASTRFARDGWGGTSIRDLARDAGIRESSVYKHFESKQAIFDTLLERADQRLAQIAAGLGVTVNSPIEALPAYSGVSEQQLIVIAEGFFDATLHDPQLVAMRRLFVVNQYRDDEVGRRLRDYWVKQPIEFQSALFAQLFATGEFRPGLDSRTTALAFFGPILMLLQLAESGGADEAYARELLAAHVRHFRRTHLRDA